MAAGGITAQAQTYKTDETFPSFPQATPKREEKSRIK